MFNNNEEMAESNGSWRKYAAQNAAIIQRRRPVWKIAECCGEEPVSKYVSKVGVSAP